MKLNLEAKIAQILAKLDPESLISLGAPTKAYRREAKLIAEKLSGCSSVGILHENLETLFHERFDVVQTHEKGSDWSAPPVKVETLEVPSQRKKILEQAAKEIFEIDQQANT